MQPPIAEPEEHQTGLARILHSIAPVRRNEVLTVVLLSLNVFVLLTCYYVLKVVREPLILLGGGAELKAYASAGQTLLLLGIVPAFGWLSGRVSRIRLMTTMQIIFIGCLVGFYVLAKAEAPIGLAFYLWLGIFNALVVSNFWSYANDLFTETEGKRLFGVIGIGASIGAILGAFVPSALESVLGFDGLMMFAIVGLGASIVLYQFVEKREGHKKDKVAAEKAAKSDAPQDKSGGFGLVMRDKYLRILAFMLLTATVINTSGEYVIGKMASERSEIYAAHVVDHAPEDAPAPARPAVKPDPKDPHTIAIKKAQGEYLNDFYSSYYTIVNIVSFLLQSLIVARLLTTFGIRKSLFIMPVIVLGGWAALILFTTMTTVRIEKTAENSLDYSLHNTLRQALFLPTSPEAKFKAKAAIDTFFFRMGDVVAGIGIVFLFVEVFGLGVKAFAALNVVLGVIWLFLAARAGKMNEELVAQRGHQES